MKKNSSVLNYLISLKNLEIKTDQGRINYRWGILLIFLTIALTGSNWILKAIAMTIGAVKTFILKTNITEPYEEVNTTLLIFLTVGFFIVCFLVLVIFDRSKRKLDKGTDDVKKE